jgi:hypothetical protein
VLCWQSVAWISAWKVQLVSSSAWRCCIRPTASAYALMIGCQVPASRWRLHASLRISGSAMG